MAYNDLKSLQDYIQAQIQGALSSYNFNDLKEPAQVQPDNNINFAQGILDTTNSTVGLIRSIKPLKPDASQLAKSSTSSTAMTSSTGAAGTAKSGMNMSSGLQSGLGAGAAAIGSIGAGLNNQLNPEILTARESVRSGISQLGPVGAIIGAATSVVDLIGDATGLGLDSVDRSSAKRAGISRAATANNILAAGPGVGLFAGALAGKTKKAYRSDQIDNLTSAYGGTTADIDAAGKLGGKRLLFGKRKANKFINKQNERNKLLTRIGEENELRKSSDYGNDLASQNYNRYLGNSGINMVIGKRGMKIPALEDAKEILKKFRENIIPEETQEIQKFEDGGKMNVIADGPLHSRKNNLNSIGEEFDSVTKKGVPVVIFEEGGSVFQTAEIEGGELILTKEITIKLEELYNDGSDEAMIEAGKLLTEQLINNTDDKTNKLIEDETDN